jgi:5-methylcytosine-specific restriction endonuclease McrA
LLKYPVCYSCSNAACRAWHSKNRETRLAQMRAYRVANREEFGAREQQYREANGDTRRAQRRAWGKQHLEHQREYCARRRAQQRVGGGKVTVAERAALWAYHAGLCVWCGGAARSLDHVVALDLGGPHEAANLAPSCISCNTRKFTKPPAELPAFLARRLVEIGFAA